MEKPKAKKVCTKAFEKIQDFFFIFLN